MIKPTFESTSITVLLIWRSFLASSGYGNGIFQHINPCNFFRSLDISPKFSANITHPPRSWITVKCPYSAVQLSNIAYDTAIAVAESESDFLIKTDIPYLAFAGELWGVHCEDFGENWQRYKRTVLYVQKYISTGRIEKVVVDYVTPDPTWISLLLLWYLFILNFMNLSWQTWCLLFVL